MATTGVIYSIVTLKPIACHGYAGISGCLGVSGIAGYTGNTGDTPFDTRSPHMSYPLDFNLRRVAKLRQVTIKTARDWRDSENHKWFKALEELKKQRILHSDESFGGRAFWDDLSILEEPPVIELSPSQEQAVKQMEDAFPSPVLAPSAELKAS